MYNVKRYFARALMVVAAMSALTISKADTFGSDPNLQLNMVDTCAGCVFAYVNFTAASAGQTVTSYQFYNGAGANTSNDLTPLLLEMIDTREFKIIGIGQSSTGFVAGYNSVNFVLASGTANISGANTWFGWADVDSLGNPNTGTIATSYPDGGGLVSYYHAPTTGLTLGQELSDFHAFSDSPVPDQKDRSYSLQVTTVPEGAESLCLVLMSGALFFLASRRKYMRRLE